MMVISFLFFAVMSFLFFDGHVYEVLVVAIEDVNVHIAFDAIYFASVGMLPEDPRSFVFERVDVVMRYPVGVSLEVGCVEVGGAELVSCIEYGCDAVVFFYDVHPLFDFRL